MNNVDTQTSKEKQIINEAEKIINQANETENESPKPRKKKKILIIISIILILIAISILTFIFGLVTSFSDKIISGVSINGIDISGLTKSQATQKIESQLSNRASAELNLSHKDYTTTINLQDLNTQIYIGDAVDSAFNIGRSEGNVFIKNFKIISTKFNKENIIPNITFNEDNFNATIEQINNELPDKVINVSYNIEENNLIVKNSSNGYRVQNNTLKANIENAIFDNQLNIQIPVEQFEANTVDIEAIYNEVHKDPIDAHFTTDPYQLFKEEDGLDFDITLEEAKAIVSEQQDTFTIPLKVLKPQITVKDLSAEAFPDLLGSYSTSYATSNYNRSTNIELATRSVNDYILMPGETFSYNDTVGQRTAARGYKEAGVYLNGAVSTDYGGGICQVSSTLYNAVLLANLEIVERTNHTFKPSYVPAGQDATVSWGAPDFKFKNNRNYPIKIVASNSGKKIFFQIYGLKSDDDYEVKIVSYEVGTVHFTTSYQKDSSLPTGTKKVIQSGSNGCKTETYQILYKDGAEVSRTCINSDTYKPHNQIVAVGTGATPKPNKKSPSNTSISDDVTVTVH